MIKKIHIYDLDGTLIDSSHRYRTDTSNKKIDLDYWVKFDTPEYIKKDKLLPLATRYKRELRNPTIYVMVATARACVKGDANYVFLRDTLGFPNVFIHRRGRGDTRRGAALKIQAIKPLLNLKQFAKAQVVIFEDNISYLYDMCHELHATTGHYIPSTQGH